MNFKLLYLILFLFIISGGVNAQFTDSLTVEVGSLLNAAVEDFQPLWLVSNKFGATADRGIDISTHFRLSNKHKLKNRDSKMLCHKVRHRDPNVYFDYAVDLYVNNHLQEVFFQEAYIRLGYKNWGLRLGRFEEVLGEMDPQLSTGSLGISGNSKPVPMLQFAISDYTSLPFSNDWLQIKAQLAHGWMGKNRYMKDAFLHSKSFYMKLGKHSLKLFGGGQHYVVWGGGRKDWRQLDRSWEGFGNVFFGKKADDGSDVKNMDNVGKNLQSPPLNRAGDHRGLLEGGLEWENRNLLLRVYQQTPFEISQGINFKNIDKLLGITLASKHPKNFLQKVVFEGIHTRQMTNYLPDQFRESYYNNGIYKTGWEYEDRIIGNPLFVNRLRGAHYFPEIKPYNWDAPFNSIDGHSNIIVNSIIGGHFGLTLLPLRKLRTRTLLTYTQNFAPSDASGPFTAEKDQVYCLQEITYQSPFQGLGFTGSLGLDFGELTSNTGFMAGVKWTFNRSLTMRRNIVFY